MTESGTMSLTSLLPFLGLLGVGNSTSSNSQGSNSSAISRTLGTAATLGLSLAILRFVVDSVKIANENSKNNTVSRDSIDSLLHRSHVLYKFVRTILTRMILLEQSKGNLEQSNSEEEEEENDDVPMIHNGSCHCRSVCFEVRDQMISLLFLAHRLSYFFLSNGLHSLFTD
jgi:hypothetical protein